MASFNELVAQSHVANHQAARAFLITCRMQGHMKFLQLCHAAELHQPSPERCPCLHHKTEKVIELLKMRIVGRHLEARAGLLPTEHPDDVLLLSWDPMAPDGHYVQIGDVTLVGCYNQAMPIPDATDTIQAPSYQTSQQNVPVPQPQVLRRLAMMRAAHQAHQEMRVLNAAPFIPKEDYKG